MLVYRCVPDNLVTRLCRRGIIWGPIQTSEDAFYDLGYMNFSDAQPYFPVGGRRLNSFEETNEKTKAFFLFPWDAIRNISCLSRRYTNFRVNILEYNIPSEILIEHLGFGYYDGEDILEFKIPISVLKGDEPFLEEVNEVRCQLIERYRERAKESFEFAISMMSELFPDKESLEEFRRKLLDQSSTKTLLGKEEIIFQYLGVSFLSETITGRSFFVTNRDAYDVYQQDKIPSMIEKSRDILTMDSYMKWKECRKEISQCFSTKEETEVCKKYLRTF